MTYNEPNERTIEIANYILENQTTIRAAAKVFGTPKSTIHHDLSVRLKYLNLPLYQEIQKLMEKNFNIKHIHGGESTKLKYLALKKEHTINEEIESTLGC